MADPRWGVPAKLVWFDADDRYDDVVVVNVGLRYADGECRFGRSVSRRLYRSLCKTLGPEPVGRTVKADRKGLLLPVNG